MVEVAQSGSASVGTKLRYEKNIIEICLFFYVDIIHPKHKIQKYFISTSNSDV